MTRRIGILGGSFNPVHIGHLAMAEISQQELKLDKVIFVPVSSPPHKSRRGLIAGRHRLKMLRLATQGNSRFAVSDLEIRRGGKSYSIETLERFKKDFPGGTRFIFIIGEDMLSGLKQWKRIDDILRIATFAVVSRSGYSQRRSAIRYRPVMMPMIGVSSSGLRRRIKSGKTIRYLVPRSVEQYIRRQKLYCRSS